MTQTERRQPPRALFKLVNPIITFLVKNNVGSLSKNLMTLTHTGRKSGKQYTIPIGYLAQDGVIYGFTLGGFSQWYKNTATHPDVTLTVKGKPIRARTERVDDAASIAHILDLYKREQAQQYTRFFGIPLEMPSVQAAVSPDLRAKYVRFVPLT